jgi:predicted nuclease with TOPRIM domain
MEAMRQSWSDDRLDHLNQRVEEGFAEVDRRFEEVDRRFDRVDERFEQMDKRFERLEGRFDRLLLTMTVVAGSLVGSVILAFAALIATQL